MVALRVELVTFRQVIALVQREQRRFGTLEEVEVRVCTLRLLVLVD